MITFEDKVSLLRIGNLTSTGWTLTILDGLYGLGGPTPHPLPGIGLTFCPKFNPGLHDWIGLFFITRRYGLT